MTASPPATTSMDAVEISLNANHRHSLSVGGILLAIVPALFLGCLFIWPLLGVLGKSVWVDGQLSAGVYANIASNSSYWWTFAATFVLAAATAAATLVLGYPLAYWMATSQRKTGLLVAVVLATPFLTSSVVRTYIWMVLFSPNGPIYNSAAAIGITLPPLLYTWTAVLVGSIYYMLPYMLVTLYAVLRTIDMRLIAAARGLGASHRQAFQYVYLPLSRDGMLGGSVLVFLVMLGAFVQPMLLGGISNQVITTSISLSLTHLSTWPTAAALATLLLVVTLLGFGLTSKITRVGFTSSR